MPFQFNPPDGFRNTVTFPQKPANETDFRDQMQQPLDQLRDFLNSGDPLPQYAGKSGAVFKGNIVFDDGTFDSPGPIFLDKVNGSQASVDLYNEEFRVFASYRNGGTIFPFQLNLGTQEALLFGLRSVRALSGGSKIHSGSGSLFVNAGSQAVTTIYYPSSYKSTPLFFCSLAGATSAYSTNTTIGSFAPNSTSCEIAINSGNSQTINYNWLALGD